MIKNKIMKYLLLFLLLPVICTSQPFYSNNTIHVTMDNVRDTFVSSHSFIIDNKYITWNGAEILIQDHNDEIYREKISTKQGEFYIYRKDEIIEQISYFPDGRYLLREKDTEKSKTRCLIFKYLKNDKNKISN